MSQDPMPTDAAPSWSDVLALVSKLDASGLADAEIVMRGVSVRVSKSALPAAVTTARHDDVATAADAGAASAASDGAETPTPAPSSPDETRGTPAPDGPTVTAPLLGVLYLRPSPDAEPFVKVGDTVTADTTVAIIEVMKLMNNVPAGSEGTVAEICGREGQMVEHGDVLMRLEASS